MHALFLSSMIVEFLSACPLHFENSNRSLFGNSLTTLNSGTFNGLTNLTSLQLSSNRLASISAFTFASLTNLNTLSLASNNLVSIADNVFAGPASLGILDLSYNMLTALGNNSFTGLTGLYSLYEKEVPFIRSLSACNMLCSAETWVTTRSLSLASNCLLASQDCYLYTLRGIRSPPFRRMSSLASHD
eukprot:m.567814 g.567814  ORF g.567814 m.567814 type:complete len:188 (+) comp57838_c0_seq53:825-1388(+)